MITKPFESAGDSTDIRQLAGQNAERQMAHYLQRAFAQAPGVHVLHGLRLVDPEQPEADGSPGVCQIDHLIVHRWGMFIVESKSVSERVAVRSDGSGGDEWARFYRGRPVGMPSPIQQAARQRDFLRSFLDRHRSELLGKVPTGLRTVAKLIAGSDQRSFRTTPIQLVIAISDGGNIQRVNDWREPEKPFRVFVSKADLVTEKISAELKEHRLRSNLLRDRNGDYGMWIMKAGEAAAVAQFLAARNSPLARPRTAEAAVDPGPAQGGDVAAQPSTSPQTAACTKCGGSDLTAHWGKYGYYWKCTACGANTAMSVVCSACGAQGRAGKSVRIRKSGPVYDRVCGACGTEERVWLDAAQSGEQR